MLHVAPHKMWTVCILLMTFASTCHIKMHIVFVFNHCLICYCGLHILVQMYMDVQLDDEWIRVKGDPLVYTVRWMLERVTQLINVVYAIKES
jgi:hypothetical protein